MNIVLQYVTLLTTIGAFIAIAPVIASASDLENDASFKLAMGPTSAAQKNQSGAVEAAQGEPRPVPRRHPTHHRMRHHHSHSL